MKKREITALVEAVRPQRRKPPSARSQARRAKMIAQRQHDGSLKIVIGQQRKPHPLDHSFRSLVEALNAKFRQLKERERLAA